MRDLWSGEGKDFCDEPVEKELISVIRRRMIDRRLLGLIGKWLSVGVVEEDGRRVRPKRGTPQGGVISPLLANIFLHHVVDGFVHEWRKGAMGEVYIVCYADDLVIACELERDGRALLELLDGRLRRNGLKLNCDNPSNPIWTPLESTRWFQTRDV